MDDVTQCIKYDILIANVNDKSTNNAIARWKYPTIVFIAYLQVNTQKANWWN